ncbi:MAG: hypothetical protein Q9166_005894 [cf. Caloplaca sp. 2 TL-2023]
MSSSSTGQTSQKAQQSRLHVNCQPQKPVSGPSNPVDVFESYDFEPSQTPTRPRGGDAKPPDGSPITRFLGDSGDNLDLEQLDHRLEDINFVKEVRRTRAKVPPEVRQQDGVSVEARAGTALQSPAGAAGGKRRKGSVSSINHWPADKTQLRRVLLEWGHVQRQGDNVQQYVLDAFVEPPGADIGSQNCVIWQHSDLEDIRLDGLNSLVAQMKAAGLEETVIGLSKRLLNRVRLITERDFVNGSFLTPTAMRYDLHDASWYIGDKCCMFVNFPYFAVGEERTQSRFDKGDGRHPIRTLLQSRYRLNETIDRDKSQCIRMVSGSALKSCIQAPSKDTKHLTRKVNDELIYVPQMWALIMGLDHILTVGPISGRALQTSALMLNDDPSPEDARRCSSVRISFMNDNIVEGITYPRDQCASWFALLNKHQEIRNALPQKKRERASQDFPLMIGEQILTDRIWASVQRLASEPILELWMKVLKLPKVTVKDSNGGSSPQNQQLRNDDDDLNRQERSAQMRTSAGFEELQRVPVVKAFLAWRVMDDYGEVDVSMADVQVKRFLEDIYTSLPARRANGDVGQGTQTAGSGSNPNAQRNPRPKLDIQGKTLENVRTLCSMSSSVAADMPVRTKIVAECEQLLGYFVPGDHDQGSTPVQLFWGTVYALLAQNCSFLAKLVERVQITNNWASRIHLGVHFERHKRSVAGGPQEYEDDISEHAILEDSMVKALRGIFCMILEALRNDESGSGDLAEKNLPSKVEYYGKEACRLLKSARDQLIAEATGTTPERNVGPVVTPEAILIKTLGRLSRGVFGSGTVDIINIYEECLEQLALRVKKHSSRRLLQKLNAFEEEVGVISEVLLQQINVLRKFRLCLDPAEFERPTIVRKMRFDFEKQEIDRMLDHIQEQLRYCKELRERAKVLAVQNVQLVETLADDNSRAIFVFTFITVLFLPLSFVAGFFGMNLLADSTKGVGQFWYIAVPLTVGILVLCAIFVAWGELLWFAASDLPEECKNMLLGRGKRRKA